MAGPIQGRRGVTSDQEVDPEYLQRDLRSPVDQFADGMAHFPIFPKLIALLTLPLVFIWPFVYVVLVFPFVLWICAQPTQMKHRTLPLLLPAEAGDKDIVDYNDPKPTRRSYEKGRGRFFWGNLRDPGGKPYEIWYSFAHALQHILCIGTTGAGKTETLISLATNYTAAGSGFMYSDAKAAPKLAWQLFTITRFFGREDDFRVLNYIKGNTSGIPDPADRRSHTVNLFAYGSSESITQIIVSIMPPGGQENKLFSERAIGLINAVMPALVDLRDNANWLITPNVLRKSLELEEVEKLKRSPHITRQAREAIRAYLASIPGYKEDPGTDRQGNPKSQAEECLKQFGFAQAYFTRALASLSDTYSDIYMVGRGELNFLDLLLRRRTAVCMIPALEKSPEEQKNLAKIVLAAQKNAVSTGLPPTVEGNREDILETLPTNAPTPYGIINDEFAFMMTEGYGALLAQARGLFCSITIAGQDYAGMKRENEAEAEQIAENTKSKYIMASEGLGDTADLVKQVAGEAVAASASGFQRDQGSMAGTYRDGQQVNFERRARIDTMDTRSQIEGEGFLLWRDKILPVQSFYHQIDDKRMIKSFRIPRLVEVELPERGHGARLLQDDSPEKKAILRSSKGGVNLSLNDFDPPQEIERINEAFDVIATQEKSEASPRFTRLIVGALAHATNEQLAALYRQMGDQQHELSTPAPGEAQTAHVSRSVTANASEAINKSNVSASASGDAPAPLDSSPSDAEPIVDVEEAPVGASAQTTQPDEGTPEFEYEHSMDDDGFASGSNTNPQRAERAIEQTEDEQVRTLLGESPWILQPGLIEQAAGRSLTDDERDIVAQAGDAVKQVEESAGAPESQAQKSGEATIEAVSQNIQYPSRAKARMQRPEDERQLKEVVDRQQAILGDWVRSSTNAPDDQSNDPSEGGA